MSEVVEPPRVPEAAGRAGRRRLLARLTLLGLSLVVALVLVETALRWVPAAWPRGSFGVARFDPRLGLNVHAGAAVYNKVRWVRRNPNDAGFMDAEHRDSKPPGTLRVGFFGDSYVEAVQVPLETTFFRRVPAQIDGISVETLAFGISGWGTLHSLMAYRELGPRYDLDWVVYVFVKNDAGDHYHALQSAHRGRVTVKPSAELSTAPPGFDVLPPQRAEGASSWRRLKRVVTRYSMLARVLRAQLRLAGATRETPTEPTGPEAGSARVPSAAQPGPALHHAFIGLRRQGGRSPR